MSYFNDVLAGPWFVSYTNLLLGTIRAGIYKSHAIAIYLLLWGAIWEFIGPLVNTNSRSDPVDLIAYEIGGVCYWLIFRNIELHAHKKGNKV